MRLFGVQTSGFVEYSEHIFSDDHQERRIQAWMEQNPQAITDDGGLLVIGREVTTDLGAYIDLLGLDRSGQVVVVELKRGQTPRDTLAQALEYTAYVARLSASELESIYQVYTGDEGVSMAEAHKEFFGLGEQDAVTFNKDQRIIIVASQITAPIRASSELLNRRGLRVTCLEFGYFCTATGEELLSTDIAVDGPVQASAVPRTSAGPRTHREAFLAGCDEAGRAVYSAFFVAVERIGLSVNWGSRGFSVRAALSDGKQQSLAYGFPLPTRTGQNKQTLSIPLAEVVKSHPQLQDELDSLRSRLLDLGVFVPSGLGSTVKWDITGHADLALADRLADNLETLASQLLVGDQPKDAMPV